MESTRGQEAVQMVGKDSGGFGVSHEFSCKAVAGFEGLGSVLKGVVLWVKRCKTALRAQRSGV